MMNHHDGLGSERASRRHWDACRAAIEHNTLVTQRRAQQRRALETVMAVQVCLLPASERDLDALASVMSCAVRARGMLT
eukprot:985441-Rhodomonas_salina.1